MNTIQSTTFTQINPKTAVPADAAGVKPAATATPAAAAAHTVAPSAVSSTSVHLLGYMSPAYFMAAFQMMPAQSMFSGMLPFQGAMPQGAPASGMSFGQMPGTTPAGTTATHASAPPSAQEAGGHVTANTTNSMAASQAAMPAGMNAMQGLGSMQNLGMMSAMAMPIGFVFAQPMMISPVLFGVFFGFAAMPGAGAGPAAPVAEQPASLPPPPDAETAPSVPVAGQPPVAGMPVEDAPAEDDAPVKAPVVEVSAEQFRKLRSRSSKLETSLQLSLTTKDGDLVKLDFSQIDLMEKSRSSGRSEGKSDEGKGMRNREIMESHDRVVSMSVEGDLDESERAAIDAVLAEVIDLANKFFTGNMDGVMQRLQSFDLDTEALAEFSLQMNMTKSVSFSRAHQPGRGSEIQKLASRDGEVMKMLEFLATEQRTLIKSASEVLDAPSAVKLVKGLLPPLLDESFAKLTQALDDADLLADESAADADLVAEQSPVEESLEA